MWSVDQRHTESVVVADFENEREAVGGGRRVGRQEALPVDLRVEDRVGVASRLRTRHRAILNQPVYYIVLYLCTGILYTVCTEYSIITKNYRYEYVATANFNR